jgi:purine-binding chemotaxis protein CheW
MDSAEGLDAILVPVGDDVYAVPIGWMREVVIAPQLTPLVTAPQVVMGLFNLRGEIVPLLDTAALLGVGRTGSVAYVVVLQTQLGPVGLSVTSFPSRAILVDQLGPCDLTGTAGTYRVGDTVAVLLDVEAVLSQAAPPAPDLMEPAEGRGVLSGRRA